MFFVYNSNTHVLTASAVGAPKGNLNKAQAHWITRDTIAWNLKPVAGGTASLHYSATGSLAIAKDVVSGQDGSAAGPTFSSRTTRRDCRLRCGRNYPHLASYSAFKVPDSADVAEALKSQLAVSAKDAAGELLTDRVADPGGARRPLHLRRTPGRNVQRRRPDAAGVGSHGAFREAAPVQRFQHSHRDRGSDDPRQPGCVDSRRQTRVGTASTTCTKSKSSSGPRGTSKRTS